MNIENIGIPIFRIYKKSKKGKGKEKEKDNYIDICVSDNKARNNFESIEAKDDEEFRLIPRYSEERCIFYISGQSGSGKTYHCRNFAEEYHKKYPKRDIYLFSLIQEDKSIDLKYIKRIDLSKLAEEEELVLSDLADSLIIYDDVDCVRDKHLKDKLKRISNQIMELGRHHNISFCYLSHLSCKGHETRTILNECSHITLFPAHMNAYNFKYITEHYIGLDKRQRLELLDLGRKNRSITYIKTYPPVIFSGKKAYIPQINIK